MEVVSREKDLEERRRRMVLNDLKRRGIRDERVLRAMQIVPRHRFVPAERAHEAYTDAPLPIGEGQTISQPYMVALMTEALSLAGGEKVLELGTGSGYQAAILAEMGVDLWTIERSATLFRLTKARLEDLGYGGVHCVEGDGTLGLANEAPFDRILATGSLPAIAEALVSQLAIGGILVAPVGNFYEQRLVRVERTAAGAERSELVACRFVPLVGAHGWREIEPR